MNERLVEEVVRRVVRSLDRHLPAAEGRSPSRAALPADWPPRRVAVGADHGGFEMKEDLRHFLEAKGYAVVDCGTHSRESVDYPDFAARVAREVSQGKCQAGIVIDGAGIGSGMAANKVAGVRCAVCHDVATVLNSREHNDANVLSLGSAVVPMALARRMVQLWLTTECSGERHLRRVRKIMEIES
ncbi:MAG: ribose 5-phosphate isomerase B [Gemmatimonadota bacterium]|nr:MAG: ribose 5-phosphate isomerase B [Gemmatimonadota bacterium]